MTSKLNSRPNAGIAIYQLPEANALDVAKRVNAKMAELGKAFPKGLTYEVPFDTTRFVNASIHEVFLTLMEAGVLVLIVIVLFLQDWRAMLVPATTIPVTIIGAFAAMAALGFTVNTTTLFGIVLAIGIVVDDAIVIVEGVAHHIERGMTPARRRHQGDGRAVRAGDRHHPGADVGVPAGRLRARPDRQDVRPVRAGDRRHRLISAINAATLKPTQCALWLRPTVPPEKRNAFFRGFNKVYGKLEDGYAWLIGSMVRRSGLMVLLALVLAGLGGWGVARLPDAFIPNEDQGYMLVGVQLPDGASLGAHRRRDRARSASIAKATPGVDKVVALAGMSVLDSNSHAGQCRRRLRDPQGLGRARSRQKGQDLRSIVEHICQRGAGAAGRPRPSRWCRRPSRASAMPAASQMQVEQRDGSFDYAKLQNATDNVIAQRQHAVGARQRASPRSAPARRMCGSTSIAPRPRR